MVMPSLEIQGVGISREVATLVISLLFLEQTTLPTLSIIQVELLIIMDYGNTWIKIVWMLDLNGIGVSISRLGASVCVTAIASTEVVMVDVAEEVMEDDPEVVIVLVSVLEADDVPLCDAVVDCDDVSVDVVCEAVASSS